MPKTAIRLDRSPAAAAMPAGHAACYGRAKALAMMFKENPGRRILLDDSPLQSHELFRACLHGQL
jgi:hypothetical protein